MPRDEKGNYNLPDLGEPAVTADTLASIDYVQVLDEVVDRLGGADALYDWAAMNPDKFWPLVFKRLPNEVTGEAGGPLLIQLKQV